MTIWRVADVHPFMQWAKFQGEPMRSTVMRDFEQMMQSLDGELHVTVNNAVYTDYWAGSDAALRLQEVAFSAGFPAAADFFFNIHEWCCECIAAVLPQEVIYPLAS